MAEDLMSLHLVVSPPSARITTRAAKPSACARWTLSKGIPMTDSPITRPRPRNSSRDGRPIRAPIRAAMIATIKTTAPTSRMTSISIMRTSFPRLRFSAQSHVCKQKLPNRPSYVALCGETGLTGGDTGRSVVALGAGSPFSLMHRLDSGDRNRVTFGYKISVQLLCLRHPVGPRVGVAQQPGRVGDGEI